MAEYEVLRDCYCGPTPERTKLWRRGQTVEFDDAEWTPHPKNFRRIGGPPKRGPGRPKKAVKPEE